MSQPEGDLSGQVPRSTTEIDNRGRQTDLAKDRPSDGSEPWSVNDTRDNDTIAAIVGAAVGALHGREALPDRWVDKLTGRTTDSDDGRVFELIEKARVKWWLLA